MSQQMIVMWGFWLSGYCCSFGMCILFVGLITDDSKNTYPFIVEFILALLWASIFYVPMTSPYWPWRYNY